MVADYVPTLKTGTTSACCSDQQSWFRAGKPSIGVFETPTSAVVYPRYHRSDDVADSGLINYEQVTSFDKGMLSCAMEYAVLE